MRSFVEATVVVYYNAVWLRLRTHKSAEQELQEENEQLQSVDALPPKKQAGVVMEDLEIRKT